MSGFDVVLRNGDVVDGTGAPPFRADVGVRQGRIAAVGAISERGREEVDAEGHVVSPGFVDGHTHMDAQMMWDPLGTPSSWHGVTTAVLGNCGFTLAPSRAGERELVVRNFERAEDIAPEALAAGIDWSWESFPQYLDVVEARPKAINYAAYVGHSALRTWAMKERAFECAATAEDLDAMEAQLRRALEAGAIGLSTSRSTSHRTSDDRPVASRLASWQELCHLVGTMRHAGGGILGIAPEPGVRGAADDQAEVLERMYALAVSSGVPITFGVLPVREDGTDWPAQLDLIDRVRAGGGTMVGQSSSRGTSIIYSFKTRMPFDLLPRWSSLRALPLAEQRRALEDPATVAALVQEARSGSYASGVGAEARAPDYEKLALLDGPLSPYRSIASLAASRRQDPVELIIATSVASNFGQLFIQPITSTDDDVCREILKHPGTVMTFSDSGAHVSQIIDYSAQTYLLAYWVRLRQAFTLEAAVHLISQRPAQVWGFHDRGVVREGYVADLNVFDPNTVGPGVPDVGFDLPAGMPRLRTRGTGFLATLVGGSLTWKDGEPVGSMPGRLLRRTDLKEIK